MNNDFGLTGHLADLVNPRLRDKVVLERREAGLGAERYGVVCGIQDAETQERCNKRICPQGWAFAVANPERYCLHHENYDGTEPAEDITSILKEHGLPWRPLKTRVKMHEATDKNKKKKKSRKNRNVQEVQVLQHRAGVRDGGDASSSGEPGGHEGPPEPPSLFKASQPRYQEEYRLALEAWKQRHPGVPTNSDPR